VKRRSSMNALKHGKSSAGAIRPRDERAATSDDSRQRWLDSSRNRFAQIGERFPLSACSCFGSGYAGVGKSWFATLLS
jgi:hypothetical protein